MEWQKATPVSQHAPSSFQACHAIIYHDLFPSFYTSGFSGRLLAVLGAFLWRLLTQYESVSADTQFCDKEVFFSDNTINSGQSSAERKKA